MTPIHTPDAPEPAGHYAQAVVHGGLVYVSGQLGRRPGQDAIADPSFEVQARQAIANLLHILAAAGSGPNRIVKLTAYVSGMEHWPVFDRLWAEALGEHRSARCVVPVGDFRNGYLVELDAIAVTGAFPSA